jgi:thioesterase domain-containing protein/acyl carrier protein
VYAFQMRGPAFRRQSFANLEGLAAAYVAALRKARPSGPYVLGGYSYGGALAYEMARQLQQQGERVAWLVLLDAYAPGSRSLEAIQQGAAGAGSLVQAAANLLALQWKGEPLLTAEMLAGLDRAGQVEEAVRRLHRSCPGTPDAESVRQSLCGLTETMERHARLLEAYRPQPLGGELRALLLRSTQGFVGESGVLAPESFAGVATGEPDHGWGRWLPEAPQIIEIPANHFSLGQEPAIGLVAEALARCLAVDDLVAVERPDLRERVLTVLKQAVLDVLPELPPEALTLETSLRDLGANSIDRVEVANAAMEALSIDVPRTALGNLNNLQALADVLCEQLAKMERGAHAEGKPNAEAAR